MQKTAARLVIFSEEVEPDRVVGAIGLKPSRVIRKGDPTGLSNPEFHPLNIAIFKAPTQDTMRLEDNLFTLLEFVEGKLDKIARIKSETGCSASIQSSCELIREGGWTLSNELLEKMTKSGLDFVFSINVRTKDEEQS